MKSIFGSSRARVLLIAATAVMVSLVLAACGSDSSSSDTSDSGSSGDTSSSSGNTSTGGTIGVMQLVQSDEAGRRLSDAVEMKAEELGYETTLIDANYDPSKELAGMDTLINQKVAAIVTVSADTELLKAKLRDAEAAGIPVIAVNGSPTVFPGTDLVINLPEEQSGKETAEAFFKDVEEKSGGEPVKVVEQVLPEALPCRLREKGFDSVAADYPNIEVVKYHIDGTNAVAAANTYTAEYLQGNSDLAGVLSCWDVPLEGALTAVEQASPDPSAFTMMGINGTSTMVAKLQEGNEYLTGDMGYALAAGGARAAEAADMAIKGDTSSFPKSKLENIELALFTDENVPEPPSIELPGWLPEGWSPDYWK